MNTNVTRRIRAAGSMNERDDSAWHAERLVEKAKDSVEKARCHIVQLKRERVRVIEELDKKISEAGETLKAEKDFFDQANNLLQMAQSKRAEDTPVMKSEVEEESSESGNESSVVVASLVVEEESTESEDFTIKRVARCSKRRRGRSSAKDTGEDKSSSQRDSSKIAELEPVAVRHKHRRGQSSAKGAGEEKSSSQTDSSRITEQEWQMEPGVPELPEYIRTRIREIGFAKNPSGGLWTPVLFLSPLDAPAGFVQNMWATYYSSFKAGKSILYQKKMVHLVLCYGIYDPDKMLGFIADKHTVSYEEGWSLKYNILPRNISEKISNGKKLSCPERQLKDGLDEILVALKLSKSDRYDRHPEKADDGCDI
mmetsp:Transcript_21770/g.31212  ORF Transcript_21770/g.31212 Transcript_21770/m.31212 type:complete len:368 (+) Transcript_21770:79-1182(+)